MVQEYFTYTGFGLVSFFISRDILSLKNFVRVDLTVAQ